ncbi:MAG: 16S rRNA (guanine(966)-N(2))-methyltransferase RsmD [Nocardioidaceae bacterium]
MTRIIGGAARGRTLRTPSGGATRPTADRVREALFSSLESTFGALSGVCFLDVFAGSGSVGLEAASRGASWVTLVERDRSVAAGIAANARTLGFTGLEVTAMSAAALSRTPSARSFDVAFLDPPYDVASETLTPILTGLGELGWLSPGAVVVLERSRHSGGWQWPDGFEAGRDRRYGDTVLWYGRFGPPPEEPMPASATEEVE